MAIDFPVSSASPWTNPETGVTYTWNDTKKLWEANVGSTPADDVYVEVAGDTMTGALVVQDNITLTGKVTSAATQAGDIATICTTKGYVDDAITASEGSETGRLDGRYVQVTGDNMTGNLTIATNKVQLNTDGRAEFEGNINAKAAIDVNKGGSKDGISSALVVWNDSGSTPAVKIAGNGSAEFAGVVTAARFQNDETGADPWLKGYNGSDESFNVKADGTINVIGTGSPLNPAASINADGSAEFAGDVRVGSPATNGVVIYEAGQILTRANSDSISLQINRSTSNNFRVDSTGDTYIGTGINATATNANITLNADGSATFAGGDCQILSNGALEVGPNTDLTASDNRGTIVSISGAVTQLKPAGTGATSTFLAGYVGAGNDVANRTYAVLADGSATFGSRADTGDWIISPINGIRYNSGSNETVKLFPDGSAEFAANVEARNFEGRRPGTNLDVFAGYADTTLTSQINADGSASFAGSVLVGAGNPFSGANLGVELTKEGKFTACRADNSSLFEGYLLNDTSAKSSISSDGKAYFKEKISCNNDVVISNRQVGTTMYPAGYVAARATNANDPVYQGYVDFVTAPTSQIFADGSASFAGEITSGNWGVDARASRVSPGLLTSIHDDPTQYAFRSYYGAYTTSNITAEISVDGNATFAGTVTANGTILTRAGGTTLDVGDSLDKTQAALTALKTAAQDNATDLAGLKAAIVAALANI